MKPDTELLRTRRLLLHYYRGKAHITHNCQNVLLLQVVGRETSNVSNASAVTMSLLSTNSSTLEDAEVEFYRERPAHPPPPHSVISAVSKAPSKMGMRLDSALKLYIGLYVVCFLLTWIISVPMLIHVTPQSECLLFVDPYMKYGHSICEYLSIRLSKLIFCLGKLVQETPFKAPLDQVQSLSQSIPTITSS